MKATHTPGQWRLGNQNHPIHIENVPNIQLVLPGNDLIVITGSNQLKNAYLVAQAPELLKQLKAIVVQIQHSHMIVPPGVSEVIDAAEGRL